MLALVACNGGPVEGTGDSTAATTSSTAATESGSGGPVGGTTSDEPTGGGTNVVTSSSAGESSGEPSPTTESGMSTSTSAAMTSSSGPDESSGGGETTGGLGETGTGGSTGEAGGTTSDETTGDGTTGEVNPLLAIPHLWYAVSDSLMYIELDPADGTVVTLVQNDLIADTPLILGQNGLTMLADGSLLGSREGPNGTQIYHVPDPPVTANTPAQAVYLGMVPNDGQMQPIRIEALYTDCEGRVYLMDTGSDVVNSNGNRLLRFSGMYLAGDLNFEVITNLQNASVGDIDDMSPGIVMGEINDKNGFAIDSGNLWQIDYITGTGMQLSGTDGDYGVHALGGPLFDDGDPRLYVLSAGDINTNVGAMLYEVSLADYTSSAALIEGPDFPINTGFNGWSGLAGPLTECMTTIPQ